MNITEPLKKSLFISLAGHIAFFCVLGFSFGVKMPPVKFCEVHFWGGVLGASDFFKGQSVNNRKAKYALGKKEAGLIPENANKEYPLAGSIYLKPQVKFAFSGDKLTFKASQAQEPGRLKAKESVIMFYPQLPYNASLYFKDRQVVHIELAFNAASSAKYNSIAIKRKVSSGNLEADLLSMRYINRYLFIQQAGFKPDNWHTVKIDLSTR